MQQGFGRGHGGGGLRACVYFVSFVRDGRSRADFFPARPQVLKSLTSVARAVADRRHDDGDQPRRWTVLSEPDVELTAALSGPLGAWVQEVGAYTEADPAALLLSARLFVMLVAESPKSNCGLSWTVTRDLLEVIGPHLSTCRGRRGGWW